MNRAVRCIFCLINDRAATPALAEYVVNGWSCCPKHAQAAVAVYEEDHPTAEAQHG